ncbi:MAG: Spy/CpxP family protein refolding chaperone [Alcanivorax sp.]|nr:Spy/CpxP family protein refolding chaperone [Alcanivorax sp.]
MQILQGAYAGKTHSGVHPVEAYGVPGMLFGMEGLSACMGMMHGDGYPPSLGLTDKQQEQIDAIWDNYWDKNWSMMAQMDVRYSDLLTLQGQEQPDINKMMALYRELNDMQLTLMESQLRTRRQADEVLTSEQRQQIQQLRHWMLESW